VDRKQVFRCNACNKNTPLVYKTDVIRDDIEHTYAECQQCGAKVTVYYTDTNIRGMLEKQQKFAKRGMMIKQRQLAAEIKLAIDQLTEMI